MNSPRLARGPWAIQSQPFLVSRRMVRRASFVRCDDLGRLTPGAFCDRVLRSIVLSSVDLLFCWAHFRGEGRAAIIAQLRGTTVIMRHR